MDMTTFFSALAGSAISTGILGILIGAWIDHRFTLVREAETRAAAAREKRREESRAVAEILAEWIRSAYMGQPSNEDLWRMQTTYWKNILGLDRELIREDADQQLTSFATTVADRLKDYVPG